MKLIVFAAALASAPWLNAAVIQNCSGGPSVCFAGVTQTVSGNLLDYRLVSRLVSTVPATASFSDSRAFVTDGYPRQGLMGLTLASVGEYGANGSSSGSVTFAGYSCSNSAQNGGCAISSAYNRSPWASRCRSTYKFRWRAGFFENNGGVPGAPVNVSVAPEPSTLALIVPALALAGMRTARKRRA